MKYMYHVFLALFAASASFAATVDLSTLTGDYEAQDGDVLTGTLNGNQEHPQPYKITIADGAKVTLSDAKINGTNENICNDGSESVPCDWAGLTCLGNCTIVLSGTNTVKGFNGDYPGIQAAKNEGVGGEYTLTIEGEGSLDASSNGSGAGIGSGYYGKSGNIIINGGNVTATGGDYAAGIGSGDRGSCGDITINDGDVTALGGVSAAGIGSGEKGNCGNININGGEITASGGWDAACIGSGAYSATCGKITISGGNVTAMADYHTAGIGSGAYSATCGKITISGGNVTATGGYNAAGIGSGPYRGTCGNITISGGKVTATGGYNAAGIGSGYGENSGYGGISGNITISGGEVTATGGYNAAGIGSGYRGTNGDITFSGGDVTAVGGENAAGIGRGIDGSSGNIIMTNDVTKVVAKRGTNASYSIIAGNGEEAGTITLGEVVFKSVEKRTFKFPFDAVLVVDLSTLEGDYEAQDGDVLTGTLDGKKKPYKITIAEEAEVTLSDAKINGTDESICNDGSDDISCPWAGLTCLGNCTIVLTGSNIVKGFDSDYSGIQAAKQKGVGAEYTLTIKGDGSLDASSNGDGAGIGCGKIEDCGNITISSGNVTAVGGYLAAGIGSGHERKNGVITISGGKVTATGGESGAGIGCGFEGLSGDIAISGGKVTATGGESGAGIGSGFSGNGGDITISGGEVTAMGGKNGAGIGSGFYGKGGNITISSGEVAATGGESGAGVGTGYYGKGGDITISRGVVTATGDNKAAGIGSGFIGTSGNITISGGEVTATGGESGPGIGYGYAGTSGNIIIDKGVTKVVAIKGRDADYSIAAGNKDAVGTITLGETEVGAVQKSPFKFPFNVELVIDLSMLAGDYEAGDGDVLKGTLDGEKQPYKITIADGARVTLSDATINGTNETVCKDAYDEGDYCRWAGLTCLGDCNIVLEGANTVKGFNSYYPGIQAAKREGEGAEYTLTIEGNGSLDASSNGYGAGIGGGYGREVGNITIRGGKVTATGGEHAAGIGSGESGTCGDITITNDVTKVVAIKGTGAPYSIGKGKGDDATVGTVTIGDVERAIEKSPFYFPAIIDLSTLPSDYEAGDGDVLKGTLDGKKQPYKITIADGAKVTLSDAKINGVDESQYSWAGLTCLGNCTLVLSGSNTVKGFDGNYPGIQAAKREGDGEEYTLTIEGDGSLVASSNGYGAGIGSDKNGSCGYITISGGKVTATGGNNAAGIGAGDEGTCGDITITDDVIKVVAIKGKNASYSIGVGDGKDAGIVTIGGEVGAVEESPFVFPTVVVDLSTLTDDYEAQDGDVLTGTLNGDQEHPQPYKITIADGATVTLSDATINGTNENICNDGNMPCPWAGITCWGNCNIVLRGTNTVKGFYENFPGIQAAKNGGEDEKYTLTIEGEGSLVASSNGYAAGIGGGYGREVGNITIRGGKVTAVGGYNAAGIGSSENGKSGDITITNDVTKVVAIKGKYASYSIGAGEGDEAGIVTIGGTVMEESVKKSPFKFPSNAELVVNLSTLTDDYEAQDGDVLTGTLNGNQEHPQPYKITIADGARVTLSDAKINGTNENICNDGSESVPCDWAGLTCLGNCTIVLEGSNTVKGFDKYYPGIQAAKNEGEGEEYTLTIEGEGSLVASSNGYGAGIGGGMIGTYGNIAIKGGTVTATGGDQAAGIGSGFGGTCDNIIISGGEVTAMGGKLAAGIGSGYDGISGDINISGGTVTATGGDQAAGIGCGFSGTCGNIIISGGEVIATGGEFGTGIGAGDEGTSGNITITNDVTKVVAIKGKYASYSIGAGEGDEVGKVTIGGEEKSPVAKELFVFPSTLVDIVDVGGKTYAVVDGDYSGEGALNIATDENVDKVIFERTFPVVDGDNNYSTIMFPFAISANKVGNVKQAFKFLGIGVDKENRKVVTVEAVTKFEAYKPYLIQLFPDVTKIFVNNTEPLVIKATPTAENAFDVAQSSNYNQYGDYVFRGVVQGKTWGAEDDDVLGTDGAAAYGFASATTTDVSVGQFVKVGEGASIKPFRGYIYKKPVPKKVKSNGGDFVHQTASIDDLPDVMDIVVVDREKDGSERTTVIGQFNSRTGEIRMNRTKRTYDLKGRSVRDASRMAKGVYLKK